MADTKEQFEKVISQCRELFEKKLKDYGPSWRIMRPQSLTDQIFIKANRIRSLEIKGVSMGDTSGICRYRELWCDRVDPAGQRFFGYHGYDERGSIGIV